MDKSEQKNCNFLVLIAIHSSAIGEHGWLGGEGRKGDRHNTHMTCNIPLSGPLIKQLSSSGLF